MLTPRLPLYIVSMYAGVIYTSTTAARRYGFGYLAEAALVGLFAHLIYNVYDTNGPRYLWWTWHDGDPSIGVRHANAPTSSSIWILTYLACHSLLARWVNDPAISLATEFSNNILKNIPLERIIKDENLRTRLTDFILKMLGFLDTFHNHLIRLPNVMKIAFCGTLCTPMFMILMGQAQIFSLDKIGIPGRRSYNLLILVYFLLVMNAFTKNEGHWTLLGNPLSHISTGCHQTYARRGEHIAYDLVGLERDDCVSGDGPHQNSRFDYAFPCKEDEGLIDAGGNEIIYPKLEADRDLKHAHHEWYTVVGIPYKNRRLETLNVLFMSLLGMYAYTRALTRTSFPSS
jgi:hypothetical protein